MRCRGEAGGATTAGAVTNSVVREPAEAQLGERDHSPLTLRDPCDGRVTGGANPHSLTREGQISTLSAGAASGTVGLDSVARRQSIVT